MGENVVEKPNEVDKEPPPKLAEGDSIAAKLSRVIARMGRVAKTGDNPHFRYAYAKLDDITRVARPLLAEEGLAILPSVVSHAQEWITDGEGKREALHTIVTVRYTLLTEKDKLEVEWVSEGEDGADKGTAKALTANAKTFLGKLLLIDTGDDPEADEQTDTRSAERSSRSAAPGGGGGRPASASQMRFLKDLLERREATVEDEKVIGDKIREHEAGGAPMGSREASEWIDRLKKLPPRAVVGEGEDLDFDADYDEGPQFGDGPYDR